MAAIRTIELLPEIFRSDTNTKFLAATVDQLVSEPDFRKIDGYIGRKFAPTYRSGDSYISEPTLDRQNYQLESSFVVEDANRDTTFYASYIDLVEKINYYGGLANNHSRLFEGESYNFDGLIDFDKFVNFHQYQWMPDGPPQVTVSANNNVTVLDYNVVRDSTQQAFTFSASGTDPNPIVTLIRGETYTFTVNQPGRPLWIQTKPGATGTQSIEAELLNRSVLGVTNNGIDKGVITFAVPSQNAQDDVAFAPRVAQVDFATDLTYNQIQSHLMSSIKKAGGIDGTASNALNGLTLIFLKKTLKDSDWIDPGIFDFDTFDQDIPLMPEPYEAGAIVPVEQRYGIFRIRILTGGIIRLEPFRLINSGEKVYVRGGVKNASVEFIQNSEGFWDPVAPITAALDELFYQDGSANAFAGRIKIINPTEQNINVTTEILGKTNYTSPNGVKFTNGMKIKFDVTVVPAAYTNNVYIIEGVGKSIRLVNAGNLLVPEFYASTDQLVTRDYITISRGSQDLNAWSRSNRWFHSELITLAAQYNNDPTLLTKYNNLPEHPAYLAINAERPIIEFEAGIYLYQYGQSAKSPVDILDFSVTDAFKQVEGQEKYSIHLPNNIVRPLTSGTRIIFAADIDPDVRKRIYRVDFITTAERTQIHLVSQNTELLPTYTVADTQIVESVTVVFVGGNPDEPAEATATVDPGTGTITSVVITNPGSNYRSLPTVSFIGGGAGTGAQLNFTLSGGTVGYINTYRLVSGGSNYSTSPVYSAIPAVTFSSPVPSIGARSAQGVAIMAPTTVANVTVSYGGLNYIADPYLKITTVYQDKATVQPVYRRHNYVDFVRLATTTPGTFSGLPGVIFSSPNQVEAITTYANNEPFTSSIISLSSVPAGLKTGQIVYGNGITGGTAVSAINGSAVTLSAPAQVAAGRLYIFSNTALNSASATTTTTRTVATPLYVIGLNSTLGIGVGFVVTGFGVPAGTTIREINTSTNEITVNQAITIGSTSVTLQFSSVNAIGSLTYANNNIISSYTANLVTVTGIGVGWTIIGEGVPLNTTVASVNLATVQITASNRLSLKDSRQLIFKAPSANTAVVLSTVRYSDVIKIDNTNLVSPDMYVSGGQTPGTIIAVTNTSPLQITTATAHLLQDGDSVVVRGVGGTTDLNDKTFYIGVVSATSVYLYTDQLLQTSLDGRSYSAYTSGGTMAAYTIEYGITVTKILDNNYIQLSSPVSVKFGTTLVFVGKTAQATARLTQSGVLYAITVTEPGSGYLAAPDISFSVTPTIAPTVTAVLNDKILEYYNIVYAGAGYQLNNEIVTEVVSAVSGEVIEETPYGNSYNTLIFDSSNINVGYVQAGWLVFLEVVQGTDTIYTDFARTPYLTKETTGPNLDIYQPQLDVALTAATIRKVTSVSVGAGQITVTLNGPINALDSDGQPIALPVGSNVHFSAKNRFFINNGTATGTPIGDIKSDFYVTTAAYNTNILELNSVVGIQHGMIVRDLSGSITFDIKVVSVDVVKSSITINRTLYINAGLPLQFDFAASVSTALTSTQVASILVTDNGAEYTSSPIITVSPSIPQVEKLATSIGTDTIEIVGSSAGLAGIAIGMTVTSEYSNDGDGITTGAQIPKVIAINTVQTGTATFRYFVQLDFPQPVFQSILLFFTLSTKALAIIRSSNVTQTITSDTTPDTYEAGTTVLAILPTAGQSAVSQKKVGIDTYYQYYYDGTDWYPAQQKTQYNQSPLFDLFDKNSVSISDTNVFTGSKFFGTRLFSYKQNSIYKKDSQLGFSPSYANFTNVGDLEFINNYDTDTFTYLKNNVATVVPVNQFFLKQLTSAGSQFRNIWTRVTENTKQYQIISHVFDNRTTYFELDVMPSDSATIPYLKVYVDNVLLKENQYSLIRYANRNAVSVDPLLLVVSPPSKIDILVYNRADVSNLGYYRMPINIDTNTENKNFGTLTLGQMRKHLIEMSQNHYGLVGDVLSVNNLRDLDIKHWTGSVLQHASPGMYSAVFLGDQGLEFVEATENAQREYSKFKYKFLDQSLKIDGVSPKDLAGSVDLIMQTISLGKNSTMPWYDSDMVPWGTATVVDTIPILDTRQLRYQLPSVFDDTVLSRRSVLVYLSDTIGTVQLIKGIDFTFNVALGAVDLKETVPLTYTASLIIVDRPSTVGSYVPETPTKLGLYPKFTPKIYLDNTYQNPTMVIQGHDGSITPAFGDLRDQLLLELEIRIYNNIKVDYNKTLLEIYDSVPGKFRSSSYTRQEFNQLLTRNFLKWTGISQVDYITNTNFTGNNPWTWNYKSLRDFTGELLPGFWRGAFQYFYDTDRPNLTPWEMLGFSEQPAWWEDRYGPAPYTGANKVLWDDLEAGYIAGGTRQGYDARFKRPGLAKVIPVDEFGMLKSPEKVMVSSFDSTNLSASWVVGDMGPVETAWRRSSEYPFAIQIAIALARPAFYFGTNFDSAVYYRDTDIDQLYMTTTNQRVTKDSFTVPDDGLNSGTVTLTAGYVNWVRDWFISKSIDGTAKIKNLIKNTQVKLSYRMAGYSDSKLLTVFADQSSPVNKSSSIVVPAESYRIFLNKTAPLSRIVYSAVIVEITATGYSVSGYSTDHPYFTIIPSRRSNNYYTITSLGETAIIYRDYVPTKLVVPYGFEFATRQELVDFLVSYQRYLIGQGMVFDTYSNELDKRQDWILSAQEFLLWSQQGWKSGNLLILSPVFNSLTINNTSGIIDQVENSLIGSRLMDQNFNIIKTSQITVLRDQNTFTVTSVFGQIIALADLKLVQYEHVLLFENTTVFNDIIYQPELGNRQFRIRLIGNKTGSWTGQINPPGYIYNSDIVDLWQSGQNYRRGTLISFKNNYYYATKEVAASVDFNFSEWSPIDKTRIKTGLLPNFALTAENFNNIYDTDNRPADSQVEELSQGIIGFRSRNYFQDLKLDATTQSKFYQGFIKQKGSVNAVNALTGAVFDNITGNISLYEEWGVRVGEYGALGSDQSVEFTLDEIQATNNPATVVMLDRTDSTIDGLINVGPDSIYNYSEDFYNKNPINNRTDIIPRINDNVVAGYVRLDDIDATIFDITKYEDYVDVVKDVGAGWKLWVAKDFNKSWNVYRATETGVIVQKILFGLDNKITIEFASTHSLIIGDLFVIKNFNSSYDGFYQVLSIVNSTGVITQGYRNLDKLKSQQSVTGTGLLLVLKSVRFDRISQLTSNTPIHGWRDNDRVWIDNDTDTNVWAVFQKTNSWSFNQLLPVRSGDWRSDEGYGKVIRSNTNNRWVLAGAKKNNSGSILGVKVTHPGFLYDQASATVDAPNLDGTGTRARILLSLVSGSLLYTRVTNSGSNYNVIPEVTILDQNTLTTSANILTNSSSVALSSLTVSTVTVAVANVSQATSLRLSNINDIWVGDVLTGSDLSGNTIPVSTFVANIDYSSNTVSLTRTISWKYTDACNLTFTRDGVFVGDTITGTDNAGNTVPVGTKVKSVTKATNTITISPVIAFNRGFGLTFSRGTGGNIQSKLTPTSVGNIQVINGGSGFTSVPTVTLLGGGGTGAVAQAEIVDGKITQVNIINGGAGYTSQPDIRLITTADTTNVDLRVRLTPTTVSGLIINSVGQNYAYPKLTFATPGGTVNGVVLNTTGSGVTGNVNVTNKSVNPYYANIAYSDFGAGYSTAPNVTVADTGGQAGSFTSGLGSGATITSVFSTGTVKVFQYADEIYTQVQNINSFGPDANEFGADIDIGLDYAFIGAPGSYANAGVVSVATSSGSGWGTKQIIRPADLSSGDRFGQAVAASKDQRWLYIGAPNANKVYVYGVKSTPSAQAKITVVPGVYSYVTSFISVLQAKELRILGNSGKTYEPNFDYTVKAGVITFSNFDTIYNESDLYISQVFLSTTIVPFFYNKVTGYVQTSYVLSTTPIEIEQITVQGSDGRVFVPGIDYSIASATLTFLNNEFSKQASIQVFVSDKYYVPVTVLTPPDSIQWLDYNYSRSTPDLVYNTYSQLAANTATLTTAVLGTITASNQIHVASITGLAVNWILTGDDGSHKFTTADAVKTRVQSIDTVTKIVTLSQAISFNDGYNVTFVTNTALPNGSLIKVLNQNQDGSYGAYSVYSWSYTNLTLSNVAVENTDVSRGVAQFGAAVATTSEGYQVVVGAPEATNNGITKAGKVYVFDRSYQVFTGAGGTTTVFPISRPLSNVTRITIDGYDVTEIADYNIIGQSISFNTTPRNGARIKVDVNQFNLIQLIETPDPVKVGYFGTSVAISPDNTNIFIGAPGYRDVDYYNGRVYRFTNQGLIYGSITATNLNPKVLLGDTIRINEVEVILNSSADNKIINGITVQIGDTSKIAQDINSKSIVGVEARTDGVSTVIFNVQEATYKGRGFGYFAANVSAVIDIPDQIPGRQATVSSVQLFANGSINTVTISDPGAGYSFAPTITFLGGNVVAASAATDIFNSPLKIYTTDAAKQKSINILPGYGTSLNDIGLNVYYLTQVLQHPSLGVPEKYGRSVRVDNQTGETLLVASEGAATLKSTSFDTKKTTLDKDTTRFIDTLLNSGAVYVYDYLQIPGDSLASPSEYLYNQVLQDANIVFGDNFGSGIDIVNNVIMAGADTSDYYTTNSGLIHVFQNKNGVKGWAKLRTRNSLVDIDYINQAFIYSKKSQEIVSQLDYFDPAKGKILGLADQDIDYKTIYDPAIYNRGSKTSITVDPNSNWNELQVGNTWWNLDTCRYINYEQGDLNYRVAHWGELFPGSTIEVLEWVESLVLPSAYSQNGIAKYPDNSAYVEVQFVDQKSGFVKTKYYFWVKNKTTVDTIRTRRINSVNAIQNLIENPRSEGIPYLAVLASNAFSVYNIKQFLRSDDRILKIEYAQTLNQHISHNEYELLQKDNSLSFVPTKLINKLVDSLSGENSNGEVVPDLLLKDNNKLGISLRPRQTMISNTVTAIRILVNYVNKFLSQKITTQSYDLARFRAAESIPPAGSGYYDQVVKTIDQLYYISKLQLLDGYKVLVLSDSHYDNYWTIYRYTPALVNAPGVTATTAPIVVWQLTRIQSYDTTRFWSYSDWYADGYNSNTQITYIVPLAKDIISLNVVAGDVVLAQDNGQGNFELYAIDSSLNPVVVGAQNGTLQLSANLYDENQSQVGFDNGGFDQIGFSKTAAVELRNIIEGLISDIFVDTDSVEVNKLFFVMVAYILSEQRSVDWVFKTSFLTAVQKLRKLDQFPVYIQDQQSYYESYINEVKPYRSQLRNYLIDYEGLDVAETAVGDFDLAPIYDAGVGYSRAPQLGNANDLAIVKSTSRKSWLDNYKYSIQAIVLVDPGTGYTDIPSVVISGGNGSGAIAVAEINLTTGQITNITLQKAGTGYTSTPTVTFVGGNGSGARAYVILQQTGGVVTQDTLNKTVRSIKSVMSFDRTTYSSNVRKWKSYTTYHAGDIVAIPSSVYGAFVNLQDQPVPIYTTVYRVLPGKKVLGSSTIDLNQFDDRTIVEKLTGADIDNAVDRLALYNQPGSPDIAILYSSPDTQRLDAASINDQVYSQGNEWHKTINSGVIPYNHEYQYLSVGNRALIAFSKNGVDWSVYSVNEPGVDLRDACLFNGNVWISVGNQATTIQLSNATIIEIPQPAGLPSYTTTSWTVVKEVVDQYQYSPTNDNPTGSVQYNASQAVDFTSTAFVDSTRGKYVIAVGNSGFVLANPYGTSVDIPQAWYSIRPQAAFFTTNAQYLKVISKSFDNLTNINNTTYIVDMSAFGYSYLAPLGKKLKQGFVIIGGVNGNMYITTYARLDDMLHGFSRAYNYDSGKAGNNDYPWIPLSVPIGITGLGNNVSGEQLTGIAISDIEDCWIVAVGSAGSLVWNRLGSRITVKTGTSAQGADAIGKTIVDYEIDTFKNFREFDASNFVYPLTKDALSSINFSDITWDGEKFIAVGDTSTVIWGYPGRQDEIYIELGAKDPSVAKFLVSNIYEYSLFTFTGPKGNYYYKASRPAAFGDSRIYLYPYRFDSDGMQGGPVAGDAPAGYGPLDRVNTNWSISGTGIPSDTVVISVGKFAQFTWKYAKGSGRNVNINYNSVTVDRNNIQITKPITKDIVGPIELIKITTLTVVDSATLKFSETKGIALGDIVTSIGIGYTNTRYVIAIADLTVTLNSPVSVTNGEAVVFNRPGTTITFYDATGTKIQLPLAQNVKAGTTTLSFANISLLQPGYTLQSSDIIGMPSSTSVVTTRYYNVSGYLDHLAKDITDKIPGAEYRGVQVKGQAYTNTATDILSLDTDITSEFIDTELGQRPEDIVINGGKFIDTYSSHAPEELVPGQVFDSLQMNVFTAKVFAGNTQPDFGNIIAYKIFTDDKLPTVYYRLPANDTTTLTANLHYQDTEISVADITKLPEPNVSQNQPGSVWVNGEKINYFGRDVGRGVLTDIRRGAGRTAIPLIHASGSLITDASAAQEVDRDIVTPISNDTIVNNGLGDTSTYQSTIVSQIPQSGIWLSYTTSEFYSNTSVTTTGEGLYFSNTRQSGFLKDSPAYNPDIDTRIPKHAYLTDDFANASVKISVSNIGVFPNAAAYSLKLGAVRIGGEVITYEYAWTANSTLTGITRTVADTANCTILASAITGNVITALGLRDA